MFTDKPIFIGIDQSRNIGLVIYDEKDGDHLLSTVVAARSEVRDRIKDQFAFELLPQIFGWTRAPVILYIRLVHGRLVLIRVLDDTHWYNFDHVQDIAKMLLIDFI